MDWSEPPMSASSKATSFRRARSLCGVSLAAIAEPNEWTVEASTPAKFADALHQGSPSLVP